MAQAVANDTQIDLTTPYAFQKGAKIFFDEGGQSPVLIQGQISKKNTNMILLGLIIPATDDNTALLQAHFGDQEKFPNITDENGNFHREDHNLFERFSKARRRNRGKNYLKLCTQDGQKLYYYLSLGAAASFIKAGGLDNLDPKIMVQIERAMKEIAETPEQKADPANENVKPANGATSGAASTLAAAAGEAVSVPHPNGQHKTASIEETANENEPDASTPAEETSQMIIVDENSIISKSQIPDYATRQLGESEIVSIKFAKGQKADADNVAVVGFLMPANLLEGWLAKAGLRRNLLPYSQISTSFGRDTFPRSMDDHFARKIQFGKTKLDTVENVYLSAATMMRLMQLDGFPVKFSEAMQKRMEHSISTLPQRLEQHNGISPYKLDKAASDSKKAPKKSAPSHEPTKKASSISSFDAVKGQLAQAFKQAVVDGKAEVDLGTDFKLTFTTDQEALSNAEALDMLADESLLVTIDCDGSPSSRLSALAQAYNAVSDGKVAVIKDSKANKNILIHNQDFEGQSVIAELDF